MLATLLPYATICLQINTCASDALLPPNGLSDLAASIVKPFVFALRNSAPSSDTLLQASISMKVSMVAMPPIATLYSSCTAMGLAPPREMTTNLKDM